MKKTLWACVVALASLVVLVGCSSWLRPPDQPDCCAPSPRARASESPTSAAEWGNGTPEAALYSWYYARDTSFLTPDNPDTVGLTRFGGGKLLDSTMRSLSQMKTDGHHQTGFIVVENVTVHGNEPGTSMVQIEACIDVSRVDIVDRRGNSQMDDDQQSRLNAIFTAQQRTTDQVQWFISQRTDGGTACDGNEPG